MTSYVRLRQPLAALGYLFFNHAHPEWQAVQDARGDEGPAFDEKEYDALIDDTMEFLEAFADATGIEVIEQEGSWVYYVPYGTVTAMQLADDFLARLLE